MKGYLLMVHTNPTDPNMVHGTDHWNLPISAVKNTPLACGSIPGGMS